MTADDNTHQTTALRAAISIVTAVGVRLESREPALLLARDTKLPVAASYLIANAVAQESDWEKSPITIGLFFGDNQRADAGQPLHMLAWVGDGRRTADELRFRAIETADPIQPPENIRHVGTEDSPIRMEFIDHDEPQVLKKGHPFCMVGEDSRVEHVGVRDDHIPLRPNGRARIGWRVAVVGERGHGLLDEVDEVLKLKHLILGKGLRGKEIQCL